MTMTFHKQLIPDHRPEEGKIGDCYRTAIACLLGLHPAEVPHFVEVNMYDGEATYKAVQEWLAKLDMTLLRVLYPASNSFDDIVSSVSIVNPGIPFMICGKSKRGTNHVVICQDGEILHDPSSKAQPGEGLIGAADEEYWWVEFIGVHVHVRRSLR